MGIYAHKEFNMFLPAIAEKLKKEKDLPVEKRLELPIYYEQMPQNKAKEETKQTVIHIQII